MHHRLGFYFENRLGGFDLNHDVLRSHRRTMFDAPAVHNDDIIVDGLVGNPNFAKNFRSRGHS